MRVIIFICIYLFSGYLVAAPIPAKELFRSPTMSQVTFTPDNKKISALIFDDDGSYLSFIDFEEKNINLSPDSIRKISWMNTFGLMLVQSILVIIIRVNPEKPY